MNKNEVFNLEAGQGVICHHCAEGGDHRIYHAGEAFLAGSGHTPYNGKANYICRSHLDKDAVISEFDVNWTPPVVADNHKIHVYLLSQVSRHQRSHNCPVNCMDQIAGRRRAEQLEALAGEVKNMSATDALKHLMTIRDNIFINAKSSTSLVVSMTEKQWFDGIVDAVSHELVGWVSVSATGYDGNKMLCLPAYSRMLDINHCVSYVAREPNESDQSWMLRRAWWLSKYHPEVKVKHQSTMWHKDEQCHQEIVLGTVESFAAQEHLVEAGLIATRGFQMADGVEYEMLESFMKPLPSGAIARVRQTAGEPQAIGVVQLRDYQLEVVA